MKFLSLILFGISANLDALLIGASYGFRKIHISFRHNLLISLITFLGSFLSIGLGRLLEKIFPVRLMACMGSILLLLLGIFILIKYFLNHRRFTESDSSEKYSKSESTEETLHDADICASDIEPSTAPLTLTVIEATALGIILSINNVGIGFSLGMTGITLLPAMSITLLLSLLFLTLGNRLGTASRLQSLAVIADPLSGILLICLGILELFAK